MSSFRARELTVADVPEVRALAEEIWKLVYTDLLPAEQLNYMLNWMYSEGQLISEFYGSEMKWWLFYPEDSEEAMAYASGCPGDEADEWHLHKFYLHPAHHGKGLGSTLLQWLIAEARREGFDQMSLRVNRFNEAAQKCYERNGFERVREVCTDIGRGFVMDDYWMSRRLDT